MKFKCLESINSLYVQKVEDGYLAHPCCAYTSNNEYFVKNIEELTDNNNINKIRKGFETDWKTNPGCKTCLDRENAGLDSKRLRSLRRGSTDRVDWDIRPGNTCNLKCAMCSPKCSSKWNEDIEVYKKYNQGIINPYNSTSLNWDWLYEQIVNKAKFIYIAGGEPFYMKNVQEFLYKLSKNEWNAKNTTIMIQTNGVSNTEKFLDILSKFDKIEFSISIDGWEEVNELVRFPTKHEIFIKNADDLFLLNPQNLVFNITAQAMNFPNIDHTIKQLTDRYNSSIELHKVEIPSQLQINALKPHVINAIAENTSNEHILSYVKTYHYNEKLNETMKRFLLDLDKKRGTNSPAIIPWCFE